MKSFLLPILMLLCLPVFAEDPLADKATAFSRHFVDGDYPALHKMMAQEMQEAMPEEVTLEIREQMLAEGAFQELGEPWLEAVSGGFKRYRIPLHLEGISYDLRVVFDSEGLVSGFFRTSHIEPTDDKVAKKQKEAPEYLGHWEGEITIPAGDLGVIVDLSYEDGYWSGTADIPMQGVKGLPLAAFMIGDDGSFRFSLADIPGDPTFNGKLEDGVFKGEFAQAGQTLPFELRRGESVGPQRPQEPKPPFPYDVEEVTFENGEVTLAGTLTLPTGDGPFPAAILVSGSGPQDRNEEIFEHKPFMVLADHLTRAGIAVLRYDDRGVGQSTGNFDPATSEDFMGDALAAVRFLEEDARFHKNKIGIIGHSEGGMIAPMAAARSKKVAFIVLMAGTGVPGDQILVRQLGLISEAAGAPAETVAAIQAEQKKALELVVADADPETVRDQARKLVLSQIGDLENEGMEAAVDQMVDRLQSPWFRFFLAYDPRQDFRTLKIPVLALGGEKDLQVDPKQNLPEIEKALQEAKNNDFTIVELPSLNHLFQKAESGLVQEYYTLTETVNPAALDTIRDWIVERFVTPPEGE